jgi:hypothetical protein
MLLKCSIQIRILCWKPKHPGALGKLSAEDMAGILTRSLIDVRMKLAPVAGSSAGCAENQLFWPARDDPGQRHTTARCCESAPTGVKVKSPQERPTQSLLP